MAITVAMALNLAVTIAIAMAMSMTLRVSLVMDMAYHGVLHLNEGSQLERASIRVLDLCILQAAARRGT